MNMGAEYSQNVCFKNKNWELRIRYKILIPVEIKTPYVKQGRCVLWGYLWSLIWICGAALSSSQQSLELLRVCSRNWGKPRTRGSCPSNTTSTESPHDVYLRKGSLDICFIATERGKSGSEVILFSLRQKYCPRRKMKPQNKWGVNCSKRSYPVRSWLSFPNNNNESYIFSIYC